MQTVTINQFHNLILNRNDTKYLVNGKTFSKGEILNATIKFDNGEPWGVTELDIEQKPNGKVSLTLLVKSFVHAMRMLDETMTIGEFKKTLKDENYSFDEHASFEGKMSFRNEFYSYLSNFSDDLLLYYTPSLDGELELEHMVYNLYVQLYFICCDAGILSPMKEVLKASQDEKPILEEQFRKILDRELLNGDSWINV